MHKESDAATALINALCRTPHRNWLISNMTAMHIATSLRHINSNGTVLLLSLSLVCAASPPHTQWHQQTRSTSKNKRNEIQTSPSITLACGTTVQGYHHPDNSTLSVFKGLRFGKAPTGHLRFRPAVPYKCTANATLNATTEPPACMQSDGRVKGNMSEDCLFLNVYSKAVPAAQASDSDTATTTSVSDALLLTSAHQRVKESQATNGTAPKNPTTTTTSSGGRGVHDAKVRSPPLRPIVFWIYGGSNVVGSTTTYHGLENLAIEEDICLVAPNYRVSAFGFLAMNELIHGDPRNTTGNYAITDLLVALEWVQDNAREFGCDPTRVTLYGQSSGGTNIFALLASPYATGLFHAVISLSGSANISMGVPQLVSQHSAVVQATSCSNLTESALVDCLQALPPQEILDAVPPTWDTVPYTMRPHRDPTGNKDLVGLVGVDGVTVARSLTDTLAKSPYVDVPLYLSGLRDEGNIMPNSTVATWTYSNFVDYIRTTFERYPAGTIDTLLEKYAQEARVPHVPQAYYDMGADVGMNCANRQLAKLASATFTSPVFLVEFDVAPSHPFHLSPFAVGCHLPFHFWDWIVIQGAWNFSVPSGALPYVPQPQDTSATRVIRPVIMDIVHTGVSHALTPYSGSDGVSALQSHKPQQPSMAATNVFQQQGSGLNATLKVIPSYKEDLCSSLSNVGFGEQFWWIN
eukprot:m.166062 g.166062  ORF g.166062 m.166062 type:complete len:692 (+) comp14439_c1_seq6:327-2402(+)